MAHFFLEIGTSHVQAGCAFLMFRLFRFLTVLSSSVLPTFHLWIARYPCDHLVLRRLSYGNQALQHNIIKPQRVADELLMQDFYLPCVVADDVGTEERHQGSHFRKLGLHYLAACSSDVASSGQIFFGAVFVLCYSCIFSGHAFFLKLESLLSRVFFQYVSFVRKRYIYIYIWSTKEGPCILKISEHGQMGHQLTLYLFCF